VAVLGAKPLAITNCLNFGNPENPEIFWQFVKATDGLARAAAYLDTPVTGGNVSFYNEYDGKAIFPTPCIGMVGYLEDLDNRVTFHFKKPGDLVILIGKSLEELGASEVHYLVTGKDEGLVPSLDLDLAKRLNEFLQEAAVKKLLQSAHDCADGGLAMALIESAFPLALGLDLSWKDTISTAAALFGETQSRVVVSIEPDKLESLIGLLAAYKLPHSQLGKITDSGNVIINYNNDKVSATIAELKDIWYGALKKEAEI
jgi:phosphoribosylformylglycinamidine synthase